MAKPGEKRRIFKDAITSLASRGHMDIQVPDVALAGNAAFHPDDQDDLAELVDGEPTELVPAEWFVELKGDAPVVGREVGFLHLTRAGWAANKAAIKQAFLAAEFKRGDGTWETFEKTVAEHFVKVEKATKRKVKRLADQLDQLRKVKL